MVWSPSGSTGLIVSPSQRITSTTMSFASGVVSKQRAIPSRMLTPCLTPPSPKTCPAWNHVFVRWWSQSRAHLEREGNGRERKGTERNARERNTPTLQLTPGPVLGTVASKAPGIEDDALMPTAMTSTGLVSFHVTSLPVLYEVAPTTSLMVGGTGGTEGEV